MFVTGRDVLRLLHPEHLHWALTFLLTFGVIALVANPQLVAQQFRSDFLLEIGGFADLATIAAGHGEVIRLDVFNFTGGLIGQVLQFNRSENALKDLTLPSPLPQYDGFYFLPFVLAGLVWFGGLRFWIG